MKSKILNIDALQEQIRRHQDSGRKVVLCYGMFNTLHIGHIRYLKQAETFGDVLVVVITPDLHPAGEPDAHSQAHRAEALAHLDWIDAVAVNTRKDWEMMIRDLKPDIYAKGFESVQPDSTLSPEAESGLLEEMGIQRVIVKEEKLASTGQINRFLSGFPQEVIDYLHMFKKRYSDRQVFEPLNEMKKLKVLVIGDTILDEYQYCAAIGKSSKDPMLAVKLENRDLFAGGVLAIANHIAEFAGQVELVTVIGASDRQEPFIRSRLQDGVNVSFVYNSKAPTLIKSRIIDGYSMNKLIEIYTMDDKPLGGAESQSLCRLAGEKTASADLVLVADFGHGTLTPDLISYLSNSTSFIAVNTQSNAGNRGFNTISKYPRADFVSLAEHEIRLETRDLSGRLFPMMNMLMEKLSCQQFVVTRGKKGCMLYDQHRGLIQVPSFAQSVVDRVGAGDAFFGITALLAVMKIPGEIIGFVGNVVGALAVETMGNEKSIPHGRVEEYIRNLLD